MKLTGVFEPAPEGGYTCFVELRDVERLRQCGCVVLREGGADTIWHNPANQKLASVPRHNEIKQGTLWSICRQLEIPQPGDRR